VTSQEGDCFGRADHVVWRADHRREITDDLWLVAEGAKRSDLGHGFLKGDAANGLDGGLVNKRLSPPIVRYDGAAGAPAAGEPIRW
jgi:hypothetical protein